MMTNRSDSLNVLLSCLDEIEPIARHYYEQKNITVDIKENKTRVTEADKKIEEIIIKKIMTVFPDCEVCAEESNPTTKKAKKIIYIDPIDSTENFIRKIPIFGTLIAIEEQGEITTGVVAAPLLNQRWWAQKGTGAFMNGQPCNVSKITALKDALLFHGSLFGLEATETPEKIFKLLSKTHRQRGFGDFYSHLLVAMGCGECAVDFGVKPWDIAPLKIIVEEAGGKVTDINGENSIYTGSIISSNKRIHSETIAQLIS